MHHDLLVLLGRRFYSPARVFMHVEWVHNAEGEFVGLTFSGEASRLLNGNYLSSWLEFVQVKYEEFIK